MLAYAPRRDAARVRPLTLGLIIIGHAAALALVLTAKHGIKITDPFTPTEIVLIDEPPPPPPNDPPKETRNPAPPASTFDAPIPIVPPLPGPRPAVVPQPRPPIGPITGTGTEPLPPLEPPIVRTGPRFATDDAAVRPPYPDSKRISGEEASLRLRLTIDERGRVVAVEPVGKADPTFLAAARRHILRAWRYQPAMEGSKAVPSTTTITLKFELANA